MPSVIDLTLVYNRAQKGPQAEKLEKLVQTVAGASSASLNVQLGKARHLDIREPPVATDIQIHLGIPSAANVPWAYVNILIVDPDAFPDGWTSYLHTGMFDAVIFTDAATRDRVCGKSHKGHLLIGDADPADAQAVGKAMPSTSSDVLRDAVACFSAIKKGMRHLPPVLMPADCPPISVVTVSYNRRNLMNLAAYNLVLSDYPHNKIEWVVVEDSDEQMKGASDMVIGFKEKHPDFEVCYVPLAKKTSIADKRNKGVEAAKNEIVLFMDDDDFYPETSFRRRVAWLLKGRSSGGVECVGTSMLAMYDLKRGTSAVHVPAWDLAQSARLSPASLAFKKSWWLAGAAKGVEMAAIVGREKNVLEIPPQQIIVALVHGENASGLQIAAADAKPGCFWGWPEELLRFLHGLVGVAVEAETAAPGTARGKTKAA